MKQECSTKKTGKEDAENSQIADSGSSSMRMHDDSLIVEEMSKSNVGL